MKESLEEVLKPTIASNTMFMSLLGVWMNSWKRGENILAQIGNTYRGALVHY